MKCPRCQQEIHSSAKFCPERGPTTAETPRLIRSSTTDVQPVLTAVEGSEETRSETSRP